MKMTSELSSSSSSPSRRCHHFSSRKQNHEYIHPQCLCDRISSSSSSPMVGHGHSVKTITTTATRHFEQQRRHHHPRRRSRRSPMVSMTPHATISSTMMFMFMTLLSLSSLSSYHHHGVGVVNAKVTLPNYNKSFTSMPAMFGGALDSNDPPVRAHLMLIKDRPLMCAQQQDPVLGEEYGGEGNQNYNTTTLPYDDNDDNRFIIPTPHDGLPVALLIQRGSCTFWEKGQEASLLGDAIQYVIIYDNEMSPDLVPMSSEFPSNMTLVFVSMMSGHELRDMILRKMMSGFPNDPESSGILVEIDGEAPPLPNYMNGGGGPKLNLAAYFLAAMSGFLAFLVFFGCILIFAQCGCIVAHPDERGRIVLFANGARPNFGAGGNPESAPKHLLTTEQISQLEEIEYATTKGRRQPVSNDHHETNETNDTCTDVADDILDTENESSNDNDHVDDDNEEEDSSSSSDCCAVCLDEFEDGEKVRRLPCRHMFHEDCLVPWLTERHASCPYCKFDILKHLKDAEKGNVTSKDNDDEEEGRRRGGGGGNPDTNNTNTSRDVSMGRDDGGSGGDEATNHPDNTRVLVVPPHRQFWNRITTIGGWTRVRGESHSEEEERNTIVIGRQQQQTNPGEQHDYDHHHPSSSSSEIEMGDRTTVRQ